MTAPCDYCGDPIAQGDRVDVGVRSQLGRSGRRPGPMSVARAYQFHRRCYVDHIEPPFLVALEDGQARRVSTQ